MQGTIICNWNVFSLGALDLEPASPALLMVKLLTTIVTILLATTESANNTNLCFPRVYNQVGFPKFMGTKNSDVELLTERRSHWYVCTEKFGSRALSASLAEILLTSSSAPSSAEISYWDFCG